MQETSSMLACARRDDTCDNHWAAVTVMATMQESSSMLCVAMGCDVLQRHSVVRMLTYYLSLGMVAITVAAAQWLSGCVFTSSYRTTTQCTSYCYHGTS